MESVEELANYFVYVITQAQIGLEARVKAAQASIQGLLKKGWNLYEIKVELDQFKSDYPQIATNIYHMGEIMDKKEVPNNLLEPDVFYYHNLLREVPPPARLMRDPNTNQIVRVSQPFFLHVKKRFTMQELLDYWYAQTGITPKENIIRQDEGKFKYILGHYTIDEVLFAIDVSKAMRRDNSQRMLTNAFDLEKYMEPAREMLENKVNISKLQGINREIN